MVKKTKPKAEYGYYCDLCGEKICKYALDFNDSGAIRILRGIVKNVDLWEIEHKDLEVCHDCASEIAQEVVDAF